MWLLACADPPVPRSPLDPAVVQAIDLVRIRAGVDLIASDAVGGRVPGTPGHDEVRDWLVAEVAAAGLVPAGDSFVQDVPLTLTGTRYGLDEKGAAFEVPTAQTGTNILGIRPGTDPVHGDEVVLLMAHYDHLGVDATGAPYNGAFDDGAAVVALLELARALDRTGTTFPRSIGFLFTDGEEQGLQGAAYWLTLPTVPVESVVAALSVDPIGRPLLTDYRPLFTIGAERSPEITAGLLRIAPFLPTPIRRISRAGVYGFASDQDVFWNEALPALWISSGGMTFYHTTADDPETIDYGSVRDHLVSVGTLAAALASDPGRPRDLGPQPLSQADLDEAVATIDGALNSAELTDEERAVGEDFRTKLSNGDPTDPTVLGTYVAVLLYVITELAPAHPGLIPPPFPAERRR